MCKMLFIGTKEKLNEVPFDKTLPGFHLEAIKGEFLTVRDKFKNQYVYFVGTSNGCSCDFGIENGFNSLELNDDERNYYYQTIELINLIKNNTTERNTVEMYCCWVGEYSQSIDAATTVNLKEINLKEYFEVEPGEKINFIQT